MMLRAVIVDDERLAILRLQQILGDWDDVEIIGGFTKASEMLEAFPQMKPDMVFLDIDMPGRNGLELAAILLELNESLEIVFITAYNQYALEAFRVNAIDYLLKPVDPDLLRNTLLRIRKRKERERVVNIADNSRVRVQCFGSFTIFGPEGEPVRFPTQKAEELLAYCLTHHGTDVSKWIVCEHLWPGHEPEKAEHNLHTAVYRMKKTLKENGIRIKLESRKGMYRFEMLDSCDYMQFEELRNRHFPLDTSAEEEAERTLRHYRGPLFGDKDYLWCESERERVRKGFAEISKQLARSLIESKQAQRAEELLRWMLDLVPYDEEAHEWLLSMYVSKRDRTSFLTQYKKMEDMLLKEMGISPSLSIRKLYQQMIAGN